MSPDTEEVVEEGKEDEDEEEEEEEEEDDVNMGTDLETVVLWEWNLRKKNIEHDYAITGRALCIMHDVRADVNARMTGHHRDAIGRVVARLHIVPCPNKHKDIVRMSPDQIIDTFWDEYKLFNTHDKDFSNEARWNTPDVAAGRSYIWHEKYSLPYTKVLGFVACRVTLKVLGIGAAEQCWSGVKDIKMGKRSGLSGASTERRSILYTTARITEARINREAMEQIDAGPNAMFCGDDIK